MTRLNSIGLALLLSALLSAACGDGGDGQPLTPAADSGLAADSALPPGTCPADHYTPKACGTHPAGTGSQPGQVLGAFSSPLKDCDLKPATLQELSCGKALLLISVGAGWCQPCIDEMKTMEAAIHGKLCGRGLGVISIVYQDNLHNIPTSTFCATWKTQFGLKFPVLLDQLEQTKSILGTGGKTPLNLLVQPSTMKILRRWEGAVPKDFAAQIEAELIKLSR